MIIKRLIYTGIVALVLIFVGCDSKNSITSLDNDAQDVEDLLIKARQNATNENFSAAKNALEEARRIDGSGVEYKEVVAYLNEKIDERDKRLERERQAKLEQEKREIEATYNASGSTKRNVNCNLVSRDYALWNYCTKGSCDGFSDSYGLWELCKNNNVGALSGNYQIWSYLKDGNTGSFSGMAYRGAEQNKGSFASRKQFILYYMRGYIYYNYKFYH